MNEENEGKIAGAAVTAANAFDRAVSLLERVEKFALARWEEEKAHLGKRKVADR
jgi:hypothetical protein